MMRYSDIQKNWSRKIKPHLANETVQAILVKDFNHFDNLRDEGAVQ
jgi:hypothetical protein